ncbi:hydroxyethylthiazole kinase [Acinetobacter qingfengensis]|nr:hydroxyethylthiazole kinase [Acinetobacter qingfengensis]
MQHNQIIEELTSIWQQLQQTQPLVHCITNTVASNFVANVLLAIGASPAMIDNPLEAENFARIAAALSINTGTPNTEQTQAMFKAAQGATLAQTPWILDPVGYGTILKWRSETVDQLLTYSPRIIRGNASEIAALAGYQTTGKGVDTTLSPENVLQHAATLIQQNNQCIAISGTTDFILSQRYGVIAIQGGSSLQPKVTAMGCALGAVCAAYHAVTDDSTLAAIAAHAQFAYAAQQAEQTSTALGRFQITFLDALSQFRPEYFTEVQFNQH